MMTICRSEASLLYIDSQLLYILSEVYGHVIELQQCFKYNELARHLQQKYEMWLLQYRIDPPIRHLMCRKLGLVLPSNRD